ncbi:MAG: 4-phosphopantoate--beta-alanine ligase [Methermicoccaceae archaeon]
MKIPEDHPRYASLMARGRLVEGIEAGLVSMHGLVAHGRGEAFDYLIGECTTPTALMAERVACAHLIRASHPVISVNGNTSVLAGEELVQLSDMLDVPLEVNLFHYTEQRAEKISQYLEHLGASRILTEKDARIPHLSSERGRVSERGIYCADVVLVPLEDGDRCERLVQMGKVVVAIDLNPLSRTSQMAHITVVDELHRALCSMLDCAPELLDAPVQALTELIEGFDNRANLRESLNAIEEHIRSQQVR